MGTGISKRNKIKVGDTVNVQFAGTVTEVYPCCGELEVAPKGMSVSAKLRYNMVDRVIPKPPPLGSLVKIGEKKYLRTGFGDFNEIDEDGWIRSMFLKWDEIYQPGYEVATFPNAHEPPF